ncbi:MAG: NnrS family protein [Candidatus Melainabacteria bacterium HGW-Melainabacteria-1]|nr:MAG: NnrS family protein [Candidatus Melainabacteria bacterium HGW-Melainabacteria-1]
MPETSLLRKLDDAPIWAIGFRPFFLLGGLAGVSLLLLWVWVFSGHPLVALTPLWHAHEMLFGFGPAIAGGFLLTASQNWSGMRGVHGRQLMGLAGLWLLGRLALLLPWPGLAAGLDLLFLPALMISLWPYLSGAGQQRNRIFLVLFGLQIAGNLLYHLEMLGTGLTLARSGIYLALHVYLLMILVIGGRVIPAFTRGAIANARISSWPWLEKGGFALVLAWLLLELIWPAAELSHWLALAAGLSQLLRLWGWRPWQTWRKPLLLILPLGYAWLVAGFLLRGLPPQWAPPLSLATHAFTVGAIGVMMHGMITRVSLGHTGRELKASGLMVTGYGLINLAALLRVAVPWLLPSFYMPAMIWAGLLWALAFGLYVWECAPYLLGPRPDGKTG